jgi:hypothetical protein
MVSGFEPWPPGHVPHYGIGFPAEVDPEIAQSLIALGLEPAVAGAAADYLRVHPAVGMHVYSPAWGRPDIVIDLGQSAPGRVHVQAFGGYREGFGLLFARRGGSPALVGVELPQGVLFGERPMGPGERAARKVAALFAGPPRDDEGLVTLAHALRDQSFGADSIRAILEAHRSFRLESTSRVTGRFAGSARLRLTIPDVGSLLGPDLHLDFDLDESGARLVAVVLPAECIWCVPPTEEERTHRAP